MTKSNSKQNGKEKSKSKKTVDVKVVECPTDFPDWGKVSSGTSTGIRRTRQEAISSTGSRNNGPKRPVRKAKEIEFLQASKEVRELGSTTFTGYQKKLNQERIYEEVTGMKKKREKIPIKLLRKKKAKYARQTTKLENEAREAGIVIAAKKKTEKKYSEEKRRSEKSHGPEPSIGFMRKGMYRVKNR
mmetsp:Transcript_1015/g.1439  ORF Transcript_1015/g.1439 Transcript_1015/m.1439 type:complete len:187 (-) Transcript_1015:93-653(-)